MSESPVKRNVVGFAALCLSLAAIALAAFTATQEPEPDAAAPVQLSPAATPAAERKGTWICEDAAGGQTAIGNPANCGPDDLVLWCEVWEVNEATGAGKCVG